MGLEDFIGAQMLDHEHDPSSHDANPKADSTEARGGVELSELLGALQVSGGTAAGSLDVNGLAEQPAVTQPVIQAANPLLLGHG